MQLPRFDESGCLPPGDYRQTFAELRESMLVLGPADPAECPGWDAMWRDHLVDNAEILVGELRQVGITNVLSMDRSWRIKIIRMTLMATSNARSTNWRADGFSGS